MAFSAHMSVSERVFRELKSKIIEKQWLPGERIPSENQLSMDMGCSRTSIRAAIQQLTSLGLLEAHQGEGTFVREMSVDQHMNSIIPYFTLSNPDRITMLEFRYILESEIVALAALQATAEEIESLHKYTKDMQEATELEDIARADLNFHYALAKATHNSIIVRVYEILQETFLQSLRGNIITNGNLGSNYHNLITAAIEARDPNLARILMQRHLQFVFSSFPAPDRKSPLFDGTGSSQLFLDSMLNNPPTGLHKD